MSRPEFITVDEMFVHMLSTCLYKGLPASPRGTGTLDYLSYTATVLEPRHRFVQNPARALRPGYAGAKVAWDLLGSIDVDTLQFWNPNAERFGVEGQVVGEDYGNRMGLSQLDLGYLGESLEILGSVDGDSRRVWTPVWKPYDMINEEHGLLPDYPSREGVSTPCCIGFGMRIFQGELHAQVVMRSNAAFGVFPYDFFLFSVLQELCANHLRVALGPLHWHALSLHIYDRERDRVRDAVDLVTSGEWLPSYEPDEAIEMDLLTARVNYGLALSSLTGINRERLETLEKDPIGSPYERWCRDPVISRMLLGARQATEDKVA